MCAHDKMYFSNCFATNCLSYSTTLWQNVFVFRGCFVFCYSCKLLLYLCCANLVKYIVQSIDVDQTSYIIYVATCTISFSDF